MGAFAVPEDKAALMRESLVEMLAMTLFVFIGCGAVLSTGEWLAQNDADGRNVASLLPIAMAFGITITVLVYATAHISGGHINPAVTLTLVLVGECEIIRGLSFFVAQLIGATLGAALLWGGTSDMSTRLEPNGTVILDPLVGDPPYNLGANSLSPELSQGNGFLLEMMGTLLLCFTVLMTVKHNGNLAAGQPNNAPLAIGFAVLLAHIVLVPFTGCGINPARSFGPPLVVSFSGKNVWGAAYWIYWVGPICGAIIAAGIFLALKPYEIKAKNEAVVEKDEAHSLIEEGAAPLGVSPSAVVDAPADEPAEEPADAPTKHEAAADFPAGTVTKV